MSRLLAVAVILFGLLVLPETASAQPCQPGSPTLYPNISTNQHYLNAELVKGNCNGVYAEVRNDAGMPSQCTNGTLNAPAESCMDTTFDGDPTQARATLRRFGCGPFVGYGYYGRNYGSMPPTTFEEYGFMVTSYTVSCPPDPPDEYCTYEWNDELGQWQCMSPILIPTGNGQNYKLTSAKDGVWFDMNGDSIPTRMSWTSADSDLAFLVWDRDGDGVIPETLTGKDLVGNFTSPGAAHGFVALFDLNMALTGVWRDRLTSDDALFHRLYLWTDRNHDAVVDQGEIRPFGDQFAAILFFASPHHRRDGHGNLFAWEGTVLVRTAPGNNPTLNGRDSVERQRRVYDVFFTGQQ